jgi:hypothetical protein
MGHTTQKSGSVSQETSVYFPRTVGLLLSLGVYKTKTVSVAYSGQSFWLQIQRSRVRFPALQGPLIFVMTIEELLE